MWGIGTLQLEAERAAVTPAIGESGPRQLRRGADCQLGSPAAQRMAGACRLEPRSPTRCRSPRARRSSRTPAASLQNPATISFPWPACRPRHSGKAAITSILHPPPPAHPTPCACQASACPVFRTRLIRGLTRRRPASRGNQTLSPTQLREAFEQQPRNCQDWDGARTLGKPSLGPRGCEESSTRPIRQPTPALKLSLSRQGVPWRSCRGWGIHRLGVGIVARAQDVHERAERGKGPRCARRGTPCWMSAGGCKSTPTAATCEDRGGADVEEKAALRRTIALASPSLLGSEISVAVHYWHGPSSCAVWLHKFIACLTHSSAASPAGSLRVHSSITHGRSAGPPRPTAAHRGSPPLPTVRRPSLPLHPRRARSASGRSRGRTLSGASAAAPSNLHACTLWS
jgi:hypothetical protein